jgi:hypothetical protein
MLSKGEGADQEPRELGAAIGVPLVVLAGDA